MIALAAGVGAAYLASRAAGVVGPLTMAMLAGVTARNLNLLSRPAQTVLAAMTRGLLRAGVVLLGLQLAVPDLLDLGPAHLLVVAATVVVTFAGTWWLGPRLGVGRDRSLLLATGFSICGASAVAAMSSVVDADEDDTATSVALVTLYGSLAIVVLPLLQGPLGLDDAAFGVWVGASVHEVAQVVAAAAVAGEAALVVAVLAKLGRVVMLAPLVTCVALADRGAEPTARRATGGATDAAAEDPRRGVRRPPVVPLFVAGFLAMATVRSTGLLPSGVVSTAETVSTLLLAGAMFGLGAGVHLRTLIRTGGRSAALGAVSTLIAAGVAYAGLVLAGA
ncbi:YeiH family protein [Jiangella asiatica]|uniref:YeiH family protein n=1 Tax=Jiangella asiatica TaxID=2530372 RepID=UPI00193E9636|nr:putative sulfate exporter family transporter [Jiangella asiatica]